MLVQIVCWALLPPGGKARARAGVAQPCVGASMRGSREGGAGGGSAPPWARAGGWGS